MNYILTYYTPEGEQYWAETNAPVPSRGDSLEHDRWDGKGFVSTKYEVVEVIYSYEEDGSCTVKIGLKA